MLANNIEQLFEPETLLSEHLKDFNKKLTKKSENTAKNYMLDIKLILENITNTELKFITLKQVESITFNIFQKELNNMEESGLAHSTLKRKKASLVALYKYLTMRDLIQYDLGKFGLLDSYNNVKNSYAYMPLSVALEYVEFAKQEKLLAEEKYLLIELAIDTALRIQELLSLKWSNFQQLDDTVVLKGYGKGNKPFTDKISVNFYNKLKKNLKKEDGSDYLFSIKYPTVAKFMQRANKSLGYEETNYTFHSFKKTAVGVVYNQHNDILKAKAKGRHSSIETTLVYLEEEQTAITGAISQQDKEIVDYKEVSHEKLLEALSQMDKSFIQMLNLKLSE